MTWPEPADPEVAGRMRAACELARAALGAWPDRDVGEAWGWHGRTLGAPVTTPDGSAWLRVACAPARQPATIFWDGSIEAEQAMPISLPRPRLRTWHDWTSQPWKYRAELYERIADHPAAASPILTTAPDLPPHWWAATRAALDAIAAVPTCRLAVRQSFLDRAMPRLLGTPVSTTAAPSPWTTAHGDFHFANLCAPNLHILDFEGWGLAPAGYDAATLHTYSLLVPQAAARIRSELARMLDTPAGRYAELAVITEHLHAFAGANPAFAERLRQRVAILLSP